MKQTILIILVLFLSCSKPIEKKYQVESEFEDLKNIKTSLVNRDSKILEWQLNFLKSENRLNKTYTEILAEGQTRWNDTLKKRAEIQRKKEDENKAQIRKEQIAPICNHKWGIYYYKPTYIEVNTELSKKDQKLAATMFKWNPKENWILFNEDGTCKVKEEETDKIFTKQWSISDNGNIVLPYGWQYEKFRTSSSSITFEIEYIDEEKMDVIEVSKSINLTTKSEMKMKLIK